MALSEAEQIRGLMYVKANPPVMVFPYNKAEPRKFWMKNTYCPLDIVFCKNSEVIDICHGIPLSKKLIGPNDPSDLVVEFPRGMTKELGISVGSILRIEYQTKTLAKRWEDYLKLASDEKEDPEEDIELDIPIPDFAKDYPTWGPDSVEKHTKDFIKYRKKDLKSYKNLSGKGITAYHGGREFDDGFSLDFVGSGEGMGILGPGVYFITSKNIAKKYCKYVDRSALYTVNIKSDGLYEPAQGIPRDLHNTLKTIVQDLNLPKTTVMSLTHGKEYIGKLNAAFGPHKARQILVKAGIKGAYEKIGDHYEISVFDPSIVTIIDKESFQPNEQVGKDEDSEV